MVCDYAQPVVAMEIGAEQVVHTPRARGATRPTQVASTDAAPSGSAAEFEGLKQQARAIVKKLNTRSPSRMSIDAGAESFKCVDAWVGAIEAARPRSACSR